MKVKDLAAYLATLDQELDIATVVGDSDYWGTLYSYAQEVSVKDVQVNGPKRAGVKCLLVE